MSTERPSGKRKEEYRKEDGKRPAGGQRKRFIRKKDNDTGNPADNDRKGQSARSYGTKPDSRSGEHDKPKRTYGTRHDAQKDNDRPKRSYGAKTGYNTNTGRPKRDIRQNSREDNDRPKRSYNPGTDTRQDNPKRYIKPERDDRPKRSKGGRPDQFFARPDKKQERPEKYTEAKPERHSRDNDRARRAHDTHTAAEHTRPVKKEKIQEKNEPGEAMPLNKFVAHCGITSRREAAELVKEGKIKVNGEVMLQPGYKVQPDDKVEYEGKIISSRKNLVYILLNKPKNYITTTDDPKERRTVMDLVADAGGERVYPVGRLDRNTTGLLLLTNDGDLAQKLSHPKYNIRKLYQVTLDKALSKPHFDKIIEGLTLDDGPVKVDTIAYLDKKNEIGLEIHSGRNRIVRRIFEHLGYTVEKLDRVMYAGLTKKNIPRGKWRFLNEQEVINLKYFKQ